MSGIQQSSSEVSNKQNQTKKPIALDRTIRVDNRTHEHLHDAIHGIPVHCRETG